MVVKFVRLDMAFVLVAAPVAVGQLYRTMSATMLEKLGKCDCESDAHIDHIAWDGRKIVSNIQILT
jgi:hypothetical protein